MNRWFQGLWPPNLNSLINDKLSIAFQELFPIVMAAQIWGNEWAGKRITFHSDNIAVVGALNKCRSPSLDQKISSYSM